MILETYIGIPLPQFPVSHINPPKHERNEEIRFRHQQGESLINLAAFFGLSEQRIWQIVHRRRR